MMQIHITTKTLGRFWRMSKLTGWMLGSKEAKAERYSQYAAFNDYDRRSTRGVNVGSITTSK
jgi:hypothetical protein